MNGVAEFNNFLATHKLQLQSAGVPELYWVSLFAKLSKQIFDAGELFSLLQVGRLSDTSGRYEKQVILKGGG